MWNYNPYYENYLAHYGVLGMKWGIRRYQPYTLGSKRSGEAIRKRKNRLNPDDDILIKKSTNAYRVTINPNDDKDTKYVTIDQNDRNFYKSRWAYSLQDIEKTDSVYENQYKITKDLVSPSAKKRVEICEDLINNMSNKEIATRYADYRIGVELQSHMYVTNLNDAQKFVKNLNKKEYKEKMLENRQEGSFDEINDLMRKNVDDLYSEHKRIYNKTLKGLNEGGSKYAKSPSTFVKYIGYDEKLRAKFIDKVKEKGYTCVIDDFAKISDKRSMAPVIVFDTKEVLSKVASKKIINKDIIEASKNYSVSNEKISYIDYIKNAIPSISDAMDTRLDNIYYK